MFVLYECLCCQAEVSVTGRSLVQRSPTDCGVSECDQVKINNLETYCEWVEEERSAERNILLFLAFLIILLSSIVSQSATCTNVTTNVRRNCKLQTHFVLEDKKTYSCDKLYLRCWLQGYSFVSVMWNQNTHALLFADDLAIVSLSISGLQKKG
jgi:hypothetical protein